MLKLLEVLLMTLKKDTMLVATTPSVVERTIQTMLVAGDKATKKAKIEEAASKETSSTEEGLQRSRIRANIMSMIGSSIQLTAAWEKNLTCKECKTKGHTRRTCPEVKGKKKKKSKKDEEKAELAEEYPQHDQQWHEENENYNDEYDSEPNVSYVAMSLIFILIFIYCIAIS